jgi:hypothetical protein
LPKDLEKKVESNKSEVKTNDKQTKPKAEKGLSLAQVSSSEESEEGESDQAEPYQMLPQGGFASQWGPIAQPVFVDASQLIQIPNDTYIATHL